MNNLDNRFYREPPDHYLVAFTPAEISKTRQALVAYASQFHGFAKCEAVELASREALIAHANEAMDIADKLSAVVRATTCIRMEQDNERQ